MQSGEREASEPKTNLRGNRNRIGRLRPKYCKQLSRVLKNAVNNFRRV